MNKSEAGRLGGIATKEKYGIEFFRANGRRGGRPRALRIEDIRTSQPLVAMNNERRRMDTATVQTKSLATLKRLWKLRGEGGR